MEPYEFFLVPIQDDKAQVAIIALMALALLDVCFGVVNAWFVQHDFSSHEFRAGLIRKLGNLGMVVMADVIDAMLLGGLNLGVQPVLMIDDQQPLRDSWYRQPQHQRLVVLMACYLRLDQQQAHALLLQQQRSCLAHERAHIHLHAHQVDVSPTTTE